MTIFCITSDILYVNWEEVTWSKIRKWSEAIMWQAQIKQCFFARERQCCYIVTGTEALLYYRHFNWQQKDHVKISAWHGIPELLVLCYTVTVTDLCVLYQPMGDWLKTPAVFHSYLMTKRWCHKLISSVQLLLIITCIVEKCNLFSGRCDERCSN